MIDTIAYIVGFLSVPVGIVLAIVLFFKLLNKLGDAPADESLAEPAPKAAPQKATPAPKAAPQKTTPAPKAAPHPSLSFATEATAKHHLSECSRLGDEEGAFRCRKALAEKFHNTEYYVDYAKDLMDGTYCPRSYEKAKRYLENLRDHPEAHFLLYLIYSASSDLLEDSTIAKHLSEAIRLEYPDAFTELTHVRNNACYGHTRYAYIMYEVLNEVSVDSFMSTVPIKGAEPIFLESMFWLTIAAGLNHPIGVEFYNSYQEKYRALEADLLPLYIAGADMAFQLKRMSEFLYFLVEAAIRGHAISLEIIGKALLGGIGVNVNKDLGELCIRIAKQKKEQA